MITDIVVINSPIKAPIAIKSSAVYNSPELNITQSTKYRMQNYGNYNRKNRKKDKRQ